ncbi:aspartate aminotransferase family protein [Virgibacillus sp. NKC19-3]|uniref:aminotransferase family protein n=1 Tax=Virgibacillus saliphilus TaxID=2831674 RepID=UPI001C9B85C0|nr:aspartate aminotransferase family protein [Virgibacillus sp. NKC19-3]MBY7144290.1 aspartate aminotransferase family protein [Virgibacillus sp. NKC19-3]
MKNKGKYSLQQLKEINQNIMIHPQSVPKENADEGPSMIFSKGEGIRFTDMQGNTYIDGISQLWNVNLGHGNEELASAAYEQMKEFAYGSQFYSNSNEPAILLAEKIVDYAPGDLNGVFYTSGGSEANETAFKLGRFYWQLKGYESKNIIISLRRGYHGVTISTQRATGIKEYREFSGSGDPNIVNAEAHLLAAEKGDQKAPNFEKSIRHIIETKGSENIAAVILEPIQGAGGVHIPPEGYLQAVRDLCDEYNILMISDEVICGFGRTGKNFGIDHWKVVPDMITFAKGITSGYFPLGGVLLSETIKESINQFDENLAHGFTYTGHPTACAVGLKTLEIIERENLIHHVAEVGRQLQRGLDYIQDNHYHVTNARTVGFLGAFDLMENPEAGIPFGKDVNAAGDMVTSCSEKGLIIRPFDYETGMNILAVAPPLITTKEEVQTMIEMMDQSLTDIEKNL